MHALVGVESNSLNTLRFSRSHTFATATAHARSATASLFSPARALLGDRSPPFVCIQRFAWFISKKEQHPLHHVYSSRTFVSIPLHPSGVSTTVTYEYISSCTCVDGGFRQRSSITIEVVGRVGPSFSFPSDSRTHGIVSSRSRTFASSLSFLFLEICTRTRLGTLRMPLLQTALLSFTSTRTSSVCFVIARARGVSFLGFRFQALQRTFLRLLDVAPGLLSACFRSFVRSWSCGLFRWIVSSFPFDFPPRFVFLAPAWLFSQRL